MVDFEKDVENCLAVLRRGGIILYPTDTIWGIGCDATDETAVQRIYELKKRPAEKSMIVLVAEQKDVLRHAASPDPAVFDFIEKQERPVTVVFDGALGLAGNLVASDGSIGIRIVKEPFCRALVKRMGKPLVSTSANFSGVPAPANFTEIDEEIKKAVDYVVQYRRNEKKAAVPSMVIQWQKGKPVYLRK